MNLSWKVGNRQGTLVLPIKVKTPAKKPHPNFELKGMGIESG
jgi:hypothetical protein